MPGVRPQPADRCDGAGPNGLRTYCILDRGTNEQSTYSGEAPEGWELPDDLASN